jgi:anti-sigma B factor antagonist
MGHGTVSMDVQAGIALFALPERLDVSNTRELMLPIKQGIEGGHRRVVLDFERTQAMDSTALGALVQVYKALKAEGGELVLCNVGDAVRRVLTITRLDQILTLCADRSEALGLFSKH